MSSNAGEALALLRRAMVLLAEDDPARSPEQAQLDVTRELGMLLHQHWAQLSRWIAQVHRSGAARVDGAASTAAWLRAGLRIGDPMRQVRVAMAAEAVPEVGEAYARGEITNGHVAVVARVLPDLDDAVLAGGAGKLLAEQAAVLTPQQFERVAVRVRDHFEPEAAERRVRLRFERRYLHVSKTIEGMVAVDGLLDVEGGQFLLDTLSAVMPAPAAADERSAGQRRADALVDVCRIAANHAPTAGGEKPHVTVIVDLDTLRGEASAPGPGGAAGPGGEAAGPGGAPGPGCEAAGPGGEAAGAGGEAGLGGAAGLGRGAALADGTPLSPATARRLACDAGIIPAVLGGVGEVLDLGRLTRLVSVPLRRALVLRDRGCRFPGCDRGPQWTDGHHLVHWARGGATDLSNMLLLCRFHHTAVHEGQWTVHYDVAANTVTATRPDGRKFELISPPPSQPP